MSNVQLVRERCQLGWVLSFPSCEVLVFTRRFRILRLGAVASGITVALASLVGQVPAVEAQTTPGVSIVITPEVPSGATISTLATNVGQRILIQVSNGGSVALTNQQFVVRLGQKPDVISGVNDGAGNVGLIDPVTGAWYHTVAQLQPGASVTYAISTLKYCPGRWPIAARLGDRIAISYATWVGAADARCVADETTSPAPAAYYALAWPNGSGGFPVVPPASSTVAGVTTTTVPGAVSGATTTTVPGATTTTLVGGRPPLINLTLSATTSTTTTIPPTTTTVAGSKTKTGSAPTTTVLFCKTVGSKRYCAPKSSVYKPGQKKVVEKKATAANKKKAATVTKKKSTR